MQSYHCLCGERIRTTYRAVLYIVCHVLWGHDLKLRGHVLALACMRMSLSRWMGLLSKVGEIHLALASW